jgi:hypothetical protein
MESETLERRAYLARVAEIPVPPSVAEERRKQEEDVRARLETLEHVISFDPFDRGAAEHAFKALVFAIGNWKSTA